jgi:predicted phosphoribosyltransferase
MQLRHQTAASDLRPGSTSIFLSGDFAPPGFRQIIGMSTLVRGFQPSQGLELQLPAKQGILTPDDHFRQRRDSSDVRSNACGLRRPQNTKEKTMAFENRAEAGQILARILDKYRGQKALVLAIPRGAVPMGKIVADALNGDLDVVLVRKLRAPENPELAIGSIDETGAVYLDPQTRDLWNDAYLEEEKKVQLETLQRRRQMYQPAGSPIDAAGRVVIVLDDGIATGSTMIAALRAVRARHPAKLIAATGVASTEALRLIRREADEVVSVETPTVLYAIGYHFRDFSQVSDEDVVATLREARRPRASTGATA